MLRLAMQAGLNALAKVRLAAKYLRFQRFVLASSFATANLRSEKPIYLVAFPFPAKR